MQALLLNGAYSKRSGLFRVDLGTGGTGLGRGEETEFLMRARDAGAHGVYVGEALCFHSYDPRRLRLSALYYYGMLCGKSHNAIFARKPCGSYWDAAWFALRDCISWRKGAAIVSANASLMLESRSEPDRNTAGGSDCRSFFLN